MSECRLIRGGAGFRGKQSLDYFSGISAESAGTKAICMPYNPIDRPVRAVIARTDPNEQGSVVLLEDAETA